MAIRPRWTARARVVPAPPSCGRCAGLVPGSAQPHYTESEAQVREAEGILCELAAERGLGARATVT
jgi:hypothetical protein